MNLIYCYIGSLFLFRPNRIKIAWFFLSLAICCNALTITQSFGKDKTDTKIKIAFTIPLEGDSFDFAKTNYITHREMAMQLSWPLLFFKKNGEFSSASAEKWRLENNGKSVRFFLRKDLKWSDGTPLTACDFYRTFQRIALFNNNIQKELVSIKGWKKWSSGNVHEKIGITVVNDHELLFEFTNKINSKIAVFADVITLAISKDDFHEIEIGHWINSTKKLSYGPYKIKSASNKRIVIEKNPHFPKFDALEIQEIEFTGHKFYNGIELYSANDLDILTGPIGKQSHWVKKNYGKNALDVGSPRLYFLWPDQRKKIFQNSQLLDALFIILDRSTFSSSVFGSPKNALPSNVPNGMGGYKNIAHIDVTMPIEERFEKARKIIKKLGISQDNPLTLRLGVAPVPGYQVIGGFVKGSWEAIGVNLEIVPSTTFFDMVANYGKGQYDLIIGSFIEQSGNPFRYLTILEEYSYIAKVKADPIYTKMLETALDKHLEKDYLRSLQKIDSYLMNKKLILPIATNSPIAIFKPQLINREAVTQYVIPKISISDIKLKR